MLIIIYLLSCIIPLLDSFYLNEERVHIHIIASQVTTFPVSIELMNASYIFMEYLSQIIFYFLMIFDDAFFLILGLEFLKISAIFPLFGLFIVSNIHRFLISIVHVCPTSHEKLVSPFSRVAASLL